METPFDPYRELNLEKDATPAQIKTAYYELAKKHHPDKGGDAEIMSKVSKAYEILSDEQKKAHFDQTGFILGENNLQLMMTQILFQVMTEAIQMFDPDNEDILARTKEGMSVYRRRAAGTLDKIKIYQKRLLKTEKKLKAKKSTILLNMLGGEIAGINHKVSRGEMEMKAMNEAIKLLDDYDFEHIERVVATRGYYRGGATNITFDTGL
jgi:curved DNA-binding protein CbpA